MYWITYKTSTQLILSEIYQHLSTKSKRMQHEATSNKDDNQKSTKDRRIAKKLKINNIELAP